jgi:hypothetical protein
MARSRRRSSGWRNRAFWEDPELRRALRARLPPFRLSKFQDALPDATMTKMLVSLRLSGQTILPQRDQLSRSRCALGSHIRMAGPGGCQQGDMANLDSRSARVRLNPQRRPLPRASPSGGVALRPRTRTRLHPRVRRKGFEPSTPSLGSSSTEDPYASGEVREVLSSGKSVGLEPGDLPTDEA